MVIATAEGKVYEDEFQHSLSQFPSAQEYIDKNFPTIDEEMPTVEFHDFMKPQLPISPSYGENENVPSKNAPLDTSPDYYQSTDPQVINPAQGDLGRQTTRDKNIINPNDLPGMKALRPINNEPTNVIRIAAEDPRLKDSVGIGNLDNVTSKDMDIHLKNLENTIRHFGTVHTDPNGDPAVKQFLKNLPDDIESIPIDEKTIILRKKSMLMSGDLTDFSAQVKKVEGQLERGNIDLYNRPVVKNEDGSVSTVRSMSVNFDGKEVLIPTVSEDGRILSQEEAIKQYKDTGKHLGKFDTPENATSYAEQLHKDQEELYAPKMNAITDFLGRVFGNSEEKSKMVEGDRSSGYPSKEDAEFAIKNQYAYGKEWENFFNNEAANVIGKLEKGKFKLDSAEGKTFKEVFAAFNSKGVNSMLDLTKPENKPIRDKMENLFARAALAVNRDPLATLGFSPKRTMMDLLIDKANIGGVYSPDADAIYTNLTRASGSTIVHESIHRGIEMLRNRSPEARKLIDSLPGEESVVRYIMATTMGDPEKGMGKLGDEQRQTALDIFNNSTAGAKQRLQKLIDMAAEEVAKKTPGGPR